MNFLQTQINVCGNRDGYDLIRLTNLEGILVSNAFRSYSATFESRD